MFTFKLEKEDGTPRRAGDPGTRQFRTGVQATQSIWAANASRCGGPARVRAT